MRGKCRVPVQEKQLSYYLALAKWPALWPAYFQMPAHGQQMSAAALMSGGLV
jgi:hypothetical protein